MNEFKFIGSHQSVSIEGIKFVKDQVVKLNADDTKLLKSSGFYHAFVSQGELVALNAQALIIRLIRRIRRIRQMLLSLPNLLYAKLVRLMMQ